MSPLVCESKLLLHNSIVFFFYLGVMGNVYIDSIGDRIADYSLLDMTDLAEGTYYVRLYLLRWIDSDSYVTPFLIYIDW